jgi:hypothetical protein
MFRPTNFIAHKVQSTELNMRHSVPAASTVSCQDLSDSGYFVAMLKKREEATKRKTESQIFSL